MPGYQSYMPTRRYQLVVAFSPDGARLAYSSDAEAGQFNLWTQPCDGGVAVKLTDYTDHSVRDIAWAPDGATIYYLADHHGDEFHQIYRIPAAGGPPEALTNAPEVQHYLAGRPFSDDGTLLAYGANDRDESKQDTLVRDLRTGEVRRVHEQVTGPSEPVAFSPDGRWLLVSELLGNTDQHIYLVSLDGAATRHLTPHDDDVRYFPDRWLPDGSGFWLLTDGGGDFLTPARYDLATESVEVLDAPGWEVDGFAASADGRLLAWSVNENGYSRLQVRDVAAGSNLDVPAVPAGVVERLRMSEDGRRLAFLLARSVRPAEVAVVDLVAGGFRYLTDSRPDGVTGYVEPDLVRFPTHDGRQVPAFLYRPAGDGPFPVVLSIHGGPESQELPDYTYGGLYQYLLSQGVGVLAPNVRGSFGYGKEYQRLIHRDWGGAELGDFERAVKYLHTLDWVDPDRVAVFGGSFGGFATLSCVSRLPDLFAAGVSVVGPSNLVTFAKAVPPTWRELMAVWVGDPETEVEFLMSRSPITYAEQIRCPLFVIQGAQDPRVAKGESDQIVESLRSRGVEVRYDVYDDEGHGFTKRENQTRALSDLAEFLIDQLVKTM